MKELLLYILHAFPKLSLLRRRFGFGEKKLMDFQITKTHTLTVRRGVTLMIETAVSFETSVYIYRTTRSHVREGNNLCLFFPMAPQPLLGQGLLIIEALQSQSDTRHSVGLLWTSDRPVAEVST
jgi:hypothetical protein